MNTIANIMADPGMPHGLKIEFTFRVESDGLWRRGSEAWIEPALIRGK